MEGSGVVQASSSSNTTKRGVGGTTLTGVGNLIKLLPTGTVFMYQFLSPLLTNYGHCGVVNKYLTGALLLVSGFSCCFASFTDSYTGIDGTVYYGVATAKGLWSFSGDPNGKSVDLSRYRLRVGDFVHAFFSLVVFAVLGLMDPNTVECYYPSLGSSQKTVLMSLPAAVGAISSSVFVVFPCKRHGIGYPPADSTSN
ncbi:hypothetical protein H6P81_001998 [Aristolochia fimbriata]|uniref:Uncharacterized protein n=1 Tax=Aristolochia fimbriata TaxID=158543 RepID=A0AAV7F8H9_ARIFI|nr:hypothetical protein H6P81_001998 [Aristolochia fimbriata]